MLAGDRPRLLILTTCLAAIIAMVSFAIWPVFLTRLGDEWGLSNTEVGWVGGAYFVGYIIATPVLVGLTDSIDARRIFIGGALTAGIGAALFAMTATEFWSAALCWSVVGAGLAGTYMPGLQILNARLSESQRIRAVPFYTSCFSLGTGLSFFLNGHLLVHFDHHAAAWIGAGCAGMAALAVALLVGPRPPVPRPPSQRRHPLDLRPAFRKPAARGYILAYGAHTYELFAFRGWSFALFALIGTRSGLSLSLITALVTLLALAGMAASILGGRLCLGNGRHRVITLIGLSSVGAALVSALCLDAPVWIALGCLILYNICIMLDSGALTAGVVTVAEEHDRGALLAAHSVVGFAGGALAGPAVGLMLDAGGGADSLSAWSAALLVMAAGSAIVALIQWRAWRRLGFAA
ncbi:MAG: MFS transporter [Candidatus Puniceispirillaceae bacterium]